MTNLTYTEMQKIADKACQKLTDAEKTSLIVSGSFVPIYKVLGDKAYKQHPDVLKDLLCLIENRIEQNG